MRYKEPGVKIMMDYRTADEEFRCRLLREIKIEITNFMENPRGCADSYIFKTSEILAKKFTIKYTL